MVADTIVGKAIGRIGSGGGVVTGDCQYAIYHL